MPTDTKRTIAVLWHEKQRALGFHYMITHYAAIWQEDGHTVVNLFGTRQYVPADVIIVHVDLSVVPDEYLEFAARYPIVLNGKVRDIRKSTVSSLLVTRDDPWPGEVIVKASLNFGGYPERKIGAAGTAADSWIQMPKDYRVFPAISEVPAAFWTDQNLVVERFMPQREDGKYVVHNMVFLGDQLSCTKNLSNEPVIHAINQTSTSWVDPHPDVVALRKRLGFDMGKFDYVIHDGTPIVFDTNKTVGAQNGRVTAGQRARRRKRAQGLYAYFEQPS